MSFHEVHFRLELGLESYFQTSCALLRLFLTSTERLELENKNGINDVNSPANFILAFIMSKKCLDHFRFNRHFLKSIFDLFTLNRFPNVFFLHGARGGLKKIHELVSAPYRPPNKLFHFLVSPFLVFGTI